MSTAPAPESNRKPNKTRLALLAAGERLFAARPVDAVSIDEIVAAADVAKGSFYNHFKDREDLIFHVIMAIRAEVEATILRLNADVEDPARFAARATCIYFRFALDHPDRASVFLRAQFERFSTGARINEMMIRTLTQGLASGRFNISTVESAALFIMGTNQAAIARICREPSLPAAIALAQQICAIILKGLGVPATEAEMIAAQSADEIVRGGLDAPSR